MDVGVAFFQQSSCALSHVSIKGFQVWIDVAARSAPTTLAYSLGRSHE